MASREVVVNECDLCGKSEKDGRLVETHEVIVDGVGVETEICEVCWDRKLLKILAPLHQVGRHLNGMRKQQSQRKKKASTIEAPAFSG